MIMSSVVRSILGAALLLTSASAVMAASDTAPPTDKSRQIGASTATVASSNAPAAAQPAQAPASTATAASNNAAVAGQPRKAPPKFIDNNDPYGGNDPNSAAGMRAFFTPQY
jgi:hypothetical protein